METECPTSQPEKLVYKDCCAREQNFREVLNTEIQTKERELKDLKELERFLPNELPYAADRALRSILVK